MSILIDIRPLGNLANRMIQFLAAWKLRQELGDAQILNPNLPEWGLPVPPVNHLRNDATLVVDRHRPMPFSALCRLARSGNYGRIVVDNYMQRMECLPDRQTAASLFSTNHHSYEPQDDELVINVRCGELAMGIEHYPLVPADFYERIIKSCGLKPVFMGQIDQSAYCEQLKKRFPQATFLPSQGAIQDFKTVSKGRQIVISVSTFSWLAAWLSDARQIYLPMLGFLNPMHFSGRKGIDLLPTDEPRYRFFLFPVHFGIPETQALQYHPALTESCREISPSQVGFLRSQTPRLEVEPAPIDFDEIWYAYSYMHAAAEISEGWFAGPLEHYLEVGKLRGYQPLPNGFSLSRSTIDASLVDLSRDKRAAQSSLSEASLGVTTEEDASKAVSGDTTGPYAFHTGDEMNPWWSVDLEDVCWVKQVVVVNRLEIELAVRATPLLVCTSLDRWNWTPLFRTPDGLIFGRDGRPLIWTATEPVQARFVRLSVPRRTRLHLREVRILGFRDGDS